MLRHANVLAKGTSGVRPEIAERIVRALNEGRAAARPHARLDRPGRPRSDGRPRRRALRRLRAPRQRGHRAHQLERVLDGAGLARRLGRGTAREHARRHGRPRPRGVRRQPDDAPSGHRRRPAVSGALLRARAHPRPPRRELPLGAGRGAQPPGPAHLPLPAADPRRDARRARVRQAPAGDRAQRLAGEPAGHSRTRTASSRSRTSTSCRSPPRWTSSASPSHPR